MRVLCVAPYFYPKPGGLEKYAYQVCKRLAESHEIKVLCSGEKSLVENLDGMEVIRIRREYVVSNTPVAAGAPGLFSRLSEWCDVVYAHTPVPFFSDISLIFKRKPTVLVYHSPSVSGRGFVGVLAGLYSRIHALLRASADLKVAVSPYVLKKAMADLVVEPGVDAEFFRPETGKEDYLMFVGQLNRGHRWKGLDMLLHAVRESNDRLVVVGEGEMRREYELLARRLGVKAFFTGKISDEELKKAYSRAKLLILPSKSHQEAFGMCLLEANSCGTGVVGTKVGGIPCYIRHGKNGILCRPDPQSLLEAIVEAREKADKLGRLGRKVALKYPWERAAAKTEKALTEIAH